MQHAEPMARKPLEQAQGAPSILGEHAHVSMPDRSACAVLANLRATWAMRCAAWLPVACARTLARQMRLAGQDCAPNLREIDLMELMCKRQLMR